MGEKIFTPFINVTNGLIKTALYAIEKPAAFLRLTTAGIAFISTTAHTSGILKNKSIPDKEKKFLVPQEIINGTISLITFFSIATSFEKFGELLVDKGIIISKTAKNIPQFKKGIAMLFSICGTVLAFNLITPLLKNPLTVLFQKITKSKEPVKKLDVTIPSLKINNNLSLTNTNPFKNFEISLQTGILPQKTNHIIHNLGLNITR